MLKITFMKIQLTTKKPKSFSMIAMKQHLTVGISIYQVLEDTQIIHKSFTMSSTGALILIKKEVAILVPT